MCSGRRGLDTGGEHPLVFGVQASNEAAALADPDSVGELDPGPVTHIQVAEERTQITGTPTAQEGIGRRTVPVQRPVSLEQAERHHGIGADPGGPPGDADPGRQSVQFEHVLAESLENAYVGGGDQVSRGHERGTQLHDQLGGDSGRRRRFGQVLAHPQSSSEPREAEWPGPHPRTGRCRGLEAECARSANVRMGVNS